MYAGVFSCHVMYLKSIEALPKNVTRDCTHATFAAQIYFVCVQVGGTGRAHDIVDIVDIDPSSIGWCRFSFLPSFHRCFDSLAGMMPPLPSM